MINSTRKREMDGRMSTLDSLLLCSGKIKCDEACSSTNRNRYNLTANRSHGRLYLSKLVLLNFLSCFTFKQKQYEAHRFEFI